MPIKLRGLFFIFFIFLSYSDFLVNRAQAQTFQIEFSENPLNYKYFKQGDSSYVFQTIQKFTNYYILNSYLACNADSIYWEQNKVKVWMHIGQSYQIKQLEIYLDSQAGPYQALASRYLHATFDTLKLSRIAEDIIQSLENNGYPFVTVSANNAVFEAGVSTKINIDKGPYFLFDSCHIDGDAVVKKSFLEAYTGIRSGKPYNEALFRKAHAKLNQLPFLISERNPQLAFIAGGKAKPYYYLKKKRSDQLNGIIGLAPNSSTASNSNSAPALVLTGEFKLQLNNLFRSAKTLKINWRSFRARSQELKAYFSYPYILYKPLGADIGVDLLKFDTLYTVFQRQLGLQYYTSGINGFKVFYKISSTNLNSVDTALIRSSKQFPAINAIQIKNYGVSAQFNQFDYRYNPRKGYSLQVTASVGVREILRDNLISEIRFGSENYNLYDSQVLRNTQYQYYVTADKFFPLGNKSTFKLGCQALQNISPRIYFNELERMGGINSLKGFNEQSIFASQFTMLELEYRYLLGLNSNLLFFWNAAYYEDRSYGRPSPISDMPWGFGAGGNIETGAGILTLIYALGKEKNNPFDIRTGKFHFGLSSYF